MGLSAALPVVGVCSWRWPAPVRLMRPLSLPATASISSVCCGTMTGVEPNLCEQLCRYRRPPKVGGRFQKRRVWILLCSMCLQIHCDSRYLRRSSGRLNALAQPEASKRRLIVTCVGFNNHPIPWCSSGETGRKDQAVGAKVNFHATSTFPQSLRPPLRFGMAGKRVRRKAALSSGCKPRFVSVRSWMRPSRSTMMRRRHSSKVSFRRGSSAVRKPATKVSGGLR
jgi:hypothetical protein